MCIYTNIIKLGERVARPKREQIVELARAKGVLRPRDARAAGISGEYLNKLHSQGLLERLGRGLYVLPGTEPTEHQSLVEACKRVPDGVVCLLSALRFHDLTMQSPFEVWMAIDVKARKPHLTHPPLRIVRFSGAARTFGIETHRIDGATVNVYNASKTVADCFKYRNKIGLDVAMEALRDPWHKRMVTINDLWQAARVCRVANVIRPYLESLGTWPTPA